MQFLSCAIEYTVHSPAGSVLSFGGLLKNTAHTKPTTAQVRDMRAPPTDIYCVGIITAVEAITIHMTQNDACEKNRSKSRFIILAMRRIVPPSPIHQGIITPMSREAIPAVIGM